jgi:large subunit ribosomal protein L18
MESISEIRRRMRHRRHRRIRKRVQGTPERPRLAVYRSLRHLYAQVVDDVAARTLVSISTLDKEARDKLQGTKSRMERSKLLGELLATRAKERGITRVAFDRGGYLYHGHVKALAEGARESGLEF